MGQSLGGPPLPQWYSPPPQTSGLHAICSIWKLSGFNCLLFAAFRRSQALFGRHSKIYHIKTYDPYRPYIYIYISSVYTI